MYPELIKILQTSPTDANTFIKMIQNGATRIGTSAGVSIIEELKKKAVDGIIKI